MAPNWQNARPALMAGAALVLIAILGSVLVLRMTAPPVRPGEVTLYCDHSLRFLVDDIVEAFQRRSDVRVTVYSGANEEIIEVFRDNPREVDLVLPGDAHYLEAAGDLLAETAPLAWAVPVILVRAGNPEGIAGVADLAREGIALGAAEPGGTPLGRMTAAVLAQHGMTYDDIEPNIALRSEAEGELASAVRLGRIAAAIMTAPMAQASVRTDIIAIPPDEGVLIAIAAGVASDSLTKGPVNEFVAFLQGRAAAAILEQYHYATEQPAPGAESAPEDDDEGLTEVVFGG